MPGAEGWGGGLGAQCLMETVSMQEGENFGRRMMVRHAQQCDYTSCYWTGLLNIVKMGCFISCDFYHNKKKRKKLPQSPSKAENLCLFFVLPFQCNKPKIPKLLPQMYRKMMGKSEWQGVPSPCPAPTCGSYRSENHTVSGPWVQILALPPT